MRKMIEYRLREKMGIVEYKFGLLEYIQRVAVFNCTLN